MLFQELSKQLNQQRVCQVLSDHIPNNEAKLLSNGRLTCMICQHRPVFDCVKTLSQHRIGKKHLTELGKYLKCKSEHDFKKLKLKQQKEFELKQDPKTDKSKPKYLKKKMILSPSTLLPSTQQGPKPFSKKERLELVQPSAVTLVKKYLKSIPRKNGFETYLEQARESYPTTKCDSHCKSPSTVADRNCSQLQNQCLNTVNSNYEKSQAEHELKLKMSGWIKNSTGHWEKDPDVEFDSDEDEPPLP